MNMVCHKRGGGGVAYLLLCYNDNSQIHKLIDCMMSEENDKLIGLLLTMLKLGKNISLYAVGPIRSAVLYPELIKKTTFCAFVS